MIQQLKLCIHHKAMEILSTLKMIMFPKMVRDDPKLLDDRGKVPKLNGVVGGLNPDREITSLLDKESS